MAYELKRKFSKETAASVHIFGTGFKDGAYYDLRCGDTVTTSGYTPHCFQRIVQKITLK
ncbi:uncharacterized protein Dsimw501_GD29098 [Drosophila simulans]|uniref:Uncharacterized protein n=1 Tax=Drosophila simulans TaxID=7240 RepID=A0A0J9RBM3_DROSI|nr:uncharacterized protein Dsimw501_GD29098 [Drosophila simulans]